MTPKSRIAIALICLVVTAGPAAAIEVGEPVPAFELSGPGGASWSSDDLLGSVVVLEFWATWCPKCKSNMPEVSRRRRTTPTISCR